MNKLKELISGRAHIIRIAVFATIILSLPITILLVGRVQDYRQQAEYEPPGGEASCNADGDCTRTGGNTTGSGTGAGPNSGSGTGSTPACGPDGYCTSCDASGCRTYYDPMHDPNRTPASGTGTGSVPNGAPVPDAQNCPSGTCVLYNGNYVVNCTAGSCTATDRTTGVSTRFGTGASSGTAGTGDGFTCPASGNYCYKQNGTTIITCQNGKCQECVNNTTTCTGIDVPGRGSADPTLPRSTSTGGSTSPGLPQGLTRSELPTCTGHCEKTTDKYRITCDEGICKIYDRSTNAPITAYSTAPQTTGSTDANNNPANAVEIARIQEALKNALCPEHPNSCFCQNVDGGYCQDYSSNPSSPVCRGIGCSSSPSNSGIGSGSATFPEVVKRAQWCNSDNCFCAFNMNACFTYTSLSNGYYKCSGPDCSTFFNSQGQACIPGQPCEFVRIADGTPVGVRLINRQGGTCAPNGSSCQATNPNGDNAILGPNQCLAGFGCALCQNNICNVVSEEFFKAVQARLSSSNTNTGSNTSTGGTSGTGRTIPAGNTCGNPTSCDPGESPATCPSDCGGGSATTCSYLPGVPPPDNFACCGDAKCKAVPDLCKSFCPEQSSGSGSNTGSGSSTGTGTAPGGTGRSDGSSTGGSLPSSGGTGGTGTTGGSVPCTAQPGNINCRTANANIDSNVSPTATPTLISTSTNSSLLSCNSPRCRVNSDCVTNFCDPTSGTCRNTTCPAETDCTCPTAVSSSSSPTSTSAPTVTLPQGSTSLAVSVTLPGIGGTPGDNTNPQRRERTVTISVFNAQNTEVKNASGTLIFDGSKYGGTISLGSDIFSASYTVRLSFDNSLKKRLPGILTINSGSTTQTQTVKLVTGDLNQDNTLNLADYNIMITCIKNPTCPQKALADLNDDGKVEEIDINTLNRGFVTRNGD